MRVNAMGLSVGAGRRLGIRNATTTAIASMIALTSTCLVLAGTASPASAATPSTSVIIDTDIFSNSDDVGALANAFALELKGSVERPRDRRRHEDEPAGGRDELVEVHRGDRPVLRIRRRPDRLGHARQRRHGEQTRHGGPVRRARVAVDARSRLGGQRVPARARLAARRQRRDGRHRLRGEPRGAARLAARTRSARSTGHDLVAQKVKSLTVTGGGYPSRSGENNLIGNPAAAQYVAANWPTKVVYSGYEVGDGVFTGHTLSTVHPANSPSASPTRPTWARARTTAPATSPRCTTRSSRATRCSPRSDRAPTSIDSAGGNVFTPGAGNEYYLTLLERDRAREGPREAARRPARVRRPAITFTSTAPSNAAGRRAPTPPRRPAGLGQPGDVLDRPVVDLGLHGTTATGRHLRRARGHLRRRRQPGGHAGYAAGRRPSSRRRRRRGPAGHHVHLDRPGSPTVGDTYAVAATATSGSPVTLSIDASSTSGCTSRDDGRSSPSPRPSARCIVDANQAGNADYHAGPAGPAGDRRQRWPRSPSRSPRRRPPGATVGGDLRRRPSPVAPRATR